jgi:hypothetical protein
MKRKFFKFITLFILLIVFTFANNFAQNNASVVPEQNHKTERNSKINGSGIMFRLPGIWRGPVMSTTSAGSFDHWYADLRAVSPWQISQFSNLDDKTINNFSVFVVKYKGEKRIALRTEGCFANSCCITYEILDSVNEATGYYRFSDFIGGTKRAFTEFQFTDDKMTMEVYTSKFNKEKEVKLHTRWDAVLMDNEAAQTSIRQFKYPKFKKYADFENAFAGMSESIFFSFENDPYKTKDQPSMGTASFTIRIDEKLKVHENDQILVLLCTKPLWDKKNYLKENEKFFVRAVYLKYDVRNYNLKNIHPGIYYAYYFIDRNSDYKYISGDCMSTESKKTLTVDKGKTAEFVTEIDYVIE